MNDDAGEKNRDGEQDEYARINTAHTSYADNVDTDVTEFPRMTCFEKGRGANGQWLKGEERERRRETVDAG